MSEYLPNGTPIAAIPLALRERAQWVLFRLDPKEEKPEELTKVPYTNIDAKGKKYKARANDPTTWIPFDEAVRRWAASPDVWAGIGYEFSADDPYTGIDLDACLDLETGIVEQWADKELALLPLTYAEISPSGRGIKLWVETEKPHTLGAADDIHDVGGVEVYSSGRFFAVTGQVFEDAPPTIELADDDLIEQIIAREQARRQARRSKVAMNGTKPQNSALDLTKTNGTYPPLALAGLVNVLNGLHDDRWAAYDDWLRIGMALHHWGGDDAQRRATAYALFDQYSKERAPDVYGEVDAKWASFGKRNGDAKLVTVGTLIEWAKEDNASEPPHPAEAADDTRPTIDISTIDLPALMPLAWDAIVVQNDPPTLFRRAGELARLEKTDSETLVVRSVDTRVMLGILARAARWIKVTYARSARVEKEALPPAAVVDDAMVNIDERIPPITRVVSAPTFADAKTLLATPGYHAAARIYYDPKPGAIVPPVPAEPTQADLARARDLILGDLLVNFPFVSEADMAHAVALFLLPFVRELIDGPTPMHLIEAPTMGSGKGLLADALLLPALGDVPAPMAEATTDEEWRKRITSALLGGPAVIYIDNLNRMLAAGALAAALTAREFSDRILGKSEQIALPVRCVWAATANNPTLSTEIARRCIRIRIDPKDDRPWQREGFKHPKLRTWVEGHRGDLIWAALVICRYGLAHGTAGPPLGSYESWSDVLGRILDGAGFPGFLGNLDDLYNRADAEGAAWRALIGAWWEAHESTPTTASDLFPLVTEAEADVLINGKDETGRKRSFGKALSRARDRVFSIEIGGTPMRLQVADGGILHKAQRWKLAPVEGGGFGYFGGFSLSHTRDNNSSARSNTENTQNTQ
jgi:Primase C terminal 2 (PriCT-2)